MRKKLNIEGKRIEIVHQVRDKERPTLIFLHEGLGCVEMWRDFPESLATAVDCNLLVYSRVGYGGSEPADLPRPVRFMHHEALETLPALVSALGIEKHIVIGHSDGASIALVYAGGLRSPDLLGLISEAAHVFNEPICVQSIERAKAAYLEGKLRQGLAKYHHDVDNAFWGWCDVWLHPEFLKWNLEAYLPTIEVPALIIQGEEDQYGTLAQVDAIVSGIGSQAERMLVPDCRHAPHHEQREIVFEAMSRFIQKIA